MRELNVPGRLMASLQALGPIGQRWIDDLPGLLASLEAEWSISCGAPFDGGNAAYVAEALTSGGTAAVLKVALPAGIDGFTPFEQELETLLLAQGDPYVAVIRHDMERRSVLLERLGKPLASLGWSTTRQIEALTSTLARGWPPVATERLPTGAAKANWLAEFVTRAWGDLGHPCSAAAVERAVAYSAERAARFRPEAAVLVHGDGHAHNLLLAQDSENGACFRLTDPEGLVSEPAHDLGVVLRAWNQDLLAGDTAPLALSRCEEVASRSGVDPEAIWQWAFIERVSSGLLLLRLGHQEEAAAYLDVSDRLADVASPRA
ncbi:MAG: phosphotransferase [Acidobacteriota bacterium]|nr:phosphotransferase [Acidobacteriota bacterium]